MIKNRVAWIIITLVGTLLVGRSAAIAAEPGVRAVLKSQTERKQAKTFHLPDAFGRDVSLSKFRGKVVLLNFWATECGGCRVEIPWFVEFDQAYRAKGLQAVGASMDIVYEGLKGPADGWARVKPFAHEHKMRYPILMADDAVPKAYGVDALPTTYLIDKKGRIAAVYAGLVDKGDMEANLKTLLREH